VRKKYKYPNSSKYSLDKILNFSNKQNYASILISNKNNKDTYSKYETIFCFGAKEILSSNKDSFKNLKSFYKEFPDWAFGFLSYDLKNETEDMCSENIDNFRTPNLFFYIPETIIFISDEGIKVESHLSKEEIDKILFEIENENINWLEIPDIRLQFRETKEEYIQKIKSIKEHIQKGDIYEMNYCQELFSEGKKINPLSVFSELNDKSNAPFSVFFKFDNKYLLCSSPERFIQKQGDRIISQPIKGTRKRGENIVEDNVLLAELESSEKDRSENVMITDLVRNDLSKISKKSSVKVEELFGLYTFDRVHQMITTISSQLDEKYNFVDVLESTFPMGSMTGAPKIKAMELIEKYETTKRSIFSGAFGYITPAGDFDFNVVIRSILYDEINALISVMVGGAITIRSDEYEEYEECLVKAKAMIDVLKNER